MKYRVGIRRGIVCLMGGRDSLAFAGNPPSDGVTIKILVGENLKTHTSSNERMSNTELNPNDVNDTGAFSEGVASGRCPVDQQRRPGRHPATAEQRQKRLGWSKEDNRRLFECYIRSEPERRGYRKRMRDLWIARNTNEELNKVSEQRLANQVRQIKIKKWLENVEQEEIALIVRNEHQETDRTATDASNRETTSDTPEERRDQNNVPAQEDPIVPSDLEPQEGTSPEIIALRERILEVMFLEERTGLPSLKLSNRVKLRTEVAAINEAIKGIETHNITELNSLMYAAAYVTTERMGMLKKRKERRTEEPYWKRRIKQSIKTWRQDLSKIEEIRRGNMRLRQRERERLNRKYCLEENGTLHVSGMLKQKIKAGGIKIKKYDERCQQFKQNQQFRNNQKLFYEALDGKKREGAEQPDPIEATTFWRKIWSEEVSHNERASWLEEVEQEFSTIEVQEDINITIEDIRTGVSKMANWKAAGPDLVQGYWFKKLSVLHARLQLHLQECVNLGNVPEWIVKGRTVLIQKDAMKGTQADNYRPITCLPIMWKLLAGIMGEKLYQHLERNGMLADEQKGCRKRLRGAKDQLLVDKAILKNCRRRMTNLSMAWIDYKKAYDMVPHSWILKCLEMVRGAKNMITVISNSMANWKMVLTSGGTDLGQVDIRRGISKETPYHHCYLF